MRMSPSSGSFRTLAGAAIAYGLTSGGAFASEIAITPLGMRIVRPTLEGDDLAARREALLIPKVLGEFLRQYDGAALPADTIASNDSVTCFAVAGNASISRRGYARDRRANHPDQYRDPHRCGHASRND